MRTIEGHIDGVRNITFSPDSRIIASTGNDNIVKLWNVDGNLIKTLQGHADTVTSVIFSPDGRIIASLSGNFENATINLWRSDGTFIKTIDNYGIQTIKFSQDSNIIASIHRDNSVKVWSIYGNWRAIVKGHNDKINSLSFSPDNKLIASNSQDNTVRLWNLEGKELATLRGYNGEEYCRSKPEYCQVSFSSDGKIIAAFSTSYSFQSSKFSLTVQLWTSDGKKLQTIKEVSKINFRTDGKLITSTKKVGINFRTDGKLITFASKDNMSNYTVKFWNTDGKELKAFKGEGASSFNISPDGRIVALTTNKNHSLKVWSMDGALLTTIQVDRDKINNASLSPDGKIIATANDDKTIKLWSREGVLQRTLKGHTDKVNSVIFSPDGKTIASASDDKTVKLWNIEGKEIKTLQGHKDKVKRVIFSPDGKTIASASDDKTVNLWKISEDTPYKTLEGVGNRRMNFSPDSNMLAFFSGDQEKLKLYFLNSIWFKDTEFSNGDQYHDVSFTSDGKAIALASNNGVSVLSWDLDDLLKQGCNWARDYLKNNPNAKNDRTLCDDISTHK